MTKTKKLLYVLLSVIMLIATACCFVGCDSNRENRYDTIVKVIIKKGERKN